MFRSGFRRLRRLLQRTGTGALKTVPPMHESPVWRAAQVPEVQPPNSYPIEKILIHHTAGSRYETVESIRDYHVNTNGWDDIGYHWVIMQPPGNNHAVMGAGRDEDGDKWIEPGEVGAHAYGLNHRSVSVCLAGNFHTEPVPDAMYGMLVSWLYAKIKSLSLSPEDIIGHREADDKVGTTGNSTVCPGGFLDLDKLRTDVARFAG